MLTVKSAFHGACFWSGFGADIVLQPNSDLGVDLALESTQCVFDVYDTLLSTYTESG